MSDIQPNSSEVISTNDELNQPNVDDTNKIADDTGSMTDTSSIISTTSISILLGFLGIYFVIYFILGKFFNKEENPSGFNLNLGRTLDMLFLGVLGVISYSVYKQYETDPESGLFEGSISSILDYVNKPSSAFTTIIGVISFYVIAYLLGIPMDSGSKPKFMMITEGALWLLLIVILFVDFFKYVLKISLYDLFPFLSPETVPEPGEDETPEKCEPSEPVDDPTSEVFNISNNLYTYEDAQAICKSYNATLATYDQVERTYNNGGEWCNYGWSADQMILFPTQKKTWEKLQKLDEGRECNSKTPSRKNNCGRPGINGGYIANPYARFGVNCFGKKPAPTDADKARMDAMQSHVYPKTLEEQKLDKKVDYWKENANKYLQINSYSTNAWNKNDNTTA
jgi:hypothetical protein